MAGGDIAISIRNLSKAYTIAHNQEKHITLAETILARLTNPFARLKRDTFWALTDVSFDIQKGEVLGIIGRNGAGKSTLLKILSRITEPTKGEIDLYGRVGSLLEVGTGFHPELSGRENIYLNGAILGMRKKEIERQFDAIVDFAEVEQFLDTPVKRYSSGMYVRLAFAVAAHLNTEILIVDEVLAVGDAQFQKRCLGKMQDVAHSGRTVLFVSHNLASVTNLCSRGVYLRRGQVAFDGPATDAVSTYLLSQSGDSQDGERDLAAFRAVGAKPSITSARILDGAGNPANNFALGSDIIFELTFKSPTAQKIHWPVMGLVVNHTTAGVVGGVNMHMTGTQWPAGPCAAGVVRCRLKSAPFLQGTYSVDLWLTDGLAPIDNINGYLQFTVEATDIYNSGNPPYGRLGTIYLNPEWELSSGTAVSRSRLESSVI